MLISTLRPAAHGLGDDNEDRKYKPMMLVLLELQEQAIKFYTAELR